jgi:hypothetical protein
MAPERVEFVIVPHSFHRSRSGSITGPIWLRHGGRDEHASDFPEVNWIDFPVVILGWWLERLDALGNGGTECSFMDGPFEFTVSDLGNALARVCCFERRIRERVPVADFQTHVSLLRASLRSAAESALAECDRREWSGSDVERLRARVRAAR